MNIGRYDKLLLVTLLIIVAVGTITRSNKNREQIEQLQAEISGQKGQIERLKELKEQYEKLVTNYEVLEDNLTNQIEILETENEELRTIRAKLTAYSPLDNQDGQQAEGDPSKTSIGKDVGKNIVAADPKKIPYGTKLDIPDWGVVEVGDTGGALRRDNKNIRLDLFHDTYAEAMKFGVQDKEVKILKWGE